VVLTINATVNHRHSSGHMVAYIHYTLHVMTYLIDQRPWSTFPVTVVHLAYPDLRIRAILDRER
jgi:hypothetical protein